MKHKYSFKYTKHIILIAMLCTGLLAINSQQTSAAFNIKPAAISVVINELHYNNPSTDDPWEFAELYNNGSSAVDLTGWTFGETISDTDNVDLTGSTIAAGGYVLIAFTLATYASLASTSCVIDGHGNYFGLSNSPAPKTINLFDAADALVDTVSYDDTSPWPTAPDGSGPSLEKIKANDANAASNWAASLVNGGTPCAKNSVSKLAVLAHTHSPWTPAPSDTVTFKANVSDPLSTVTGVEVQVSTDGFTTNTSYAMADSNSDGMWTYDYAVGATEGTTYSYAFVGTNALSESTLKYNGFMNFTAMSVQPYISAFHSSQNNLGSEFVVITNPLGGTTDLDISGWVITDEGLAENYFGTIGSFDTAWKFPAASTIGPGESIFLAANGTDFEASFGFVADYEMNGTSTAPNMVKVLGGDDTFEIYRGGEEILLISPDAVIDVVMYSDWVGTTFDGDSFLSTYSSSQGDASFHRIEADTDDPASDAAIEFLPFIMVTNSVNGTTYDGGETLDLTIFDFGGINSSAYNWDGATNTTASGAATSTTVPTTAGAHVLHLYANDSVGNWVHVKYSFTVAEPPTSSSSSSTTTTTTTTPTTTTTTEAPTSSSSSKDDSDDGFIPGFGVWMFILSITGIMVVRRRYNN